MKILQIICLVGFMMTLPGISDAMRCGSYLVHEGDRQVTVHLKCGNPDAEFAYSSPMKNGRLNYYAGENKEVIWTYDHRKASGVLHQVRFHDGVVTNISTIRR